MRPARGRCHGAMLTAAALACLAGTLAAAQPAAPPSAPAGSAAEVLQPRAFGYTVGDLAVQRVRLSLAGRPFEPASLPAPARVSAWLERRAARVEAAPDGARWLVVEYQIVNAPRTLVTIPVPGWDLPGAAGASGLRVAPAALGVAPLTTPAPPGEALPLRPDRPAPAIDTGAIQRRLALWLAALAAVLSAWLAWLAWNAWRDRTTLPFACALRELRAQPPAAAAHLALHHAFDRAAGRVVQAASLDALFERAPHLRPLRPQVERFYAQSAELFFGAGLPADALSPQALCRGLRRLERRHAP